MIQQKQNYLKESKVVQVLLERNLIKIQYAFQDNIPTLGTFHLIQRSHKFNPNGTINHPKIVQGHQLNTIQINLINEQSLHLLVLRKLALNFSLKLVKLSKREVRKV